MGDDKMYRVHVPFLLNLHTRDPSAYRSINNTQPVIATIKQIGKTAKTATTTTDLGRPNQPKANVRM